MIGLIIMACASQEYVLPQAEVFEEDWEGSLSFTSYQGNREECSMHYSMVGFAQDCEDCSWQAEFILEPISDACAYSDLEALSFLVNKNNTWLVLEESGWEEWGEASFDEGVWSLVSSFHFFP
tara:strand:- start:1021 stop:1389 length:369 start_codon:yes stop_codon:yes gene_type:complete